MTQHPDPPHWSVPPPLPPKTDPAVAELQKELEKSWKPAHVYTASSVYYVDGKVSGWSPVAAPSYVPTTYYNWSEYEWDVLEEPTPTSPQNQGIHWSQPKNYVWHHQGVVKTPLSMQQLKQELEQQLQTELNAAEPDTEKIDGLRKLLAALTAVYVPATPKHDSYATGAEKLLEQVPGTREVVRCPAPVRGAKFKGQERPCQQTAIVFRMIVHLNDKHRWTREQIADWLDNLDVDLTFKSNTPDKKERGTP